MSDILYSKLRLVVPAELDGENATVTDSKGNARTIAMSTPKTDIMLAGMVWTNTVCKQESLMKMWLLDMVR